MKNYSCQNKIAWEYNAYDFGVKEDGSSSERAQKDKENPKGLLKKNGKMICSYRKYTISEIINAIIKSGFILERFDEHPAWTRGDLFV